MKRRHTLSLFFSLAIMLICMATVSQATYAKPGGNVIGTASARLTGCTTTTCTITIHAVVDVSKKLSSNTTYNTYISSSVCPDLSGTIYGPVTAASDSNGRFNEKTSLTFMGITKFDNSPWQVCIFLNKDNVSNPITPGNFVARGEFHLKKGSKQANTYLHLIN